MSKGGSAFETKTSPRELPAYNISEAAHYLHIPPATLRSWVLGREYPTSAGKGFFRPVIIPAEKDPPILSFVNLVEAHVLGAIRRQHKVPHLRRIERDPSGAPLRLYLFTRLAEIDEPKTVVIDPLVSFGRPVLVGSSIPTSAVAERYKAGETIQSLADDYDCPALQIEEAIRCEFELRAA